jgi:hypothetical protein
LASPTAGRISRREPSAGAEHGVDSSVCRKSLGQRDVGQLKIIGPPYKHCVRRGPAGRGGVRLR